jgi:hypothetical protein
METETETEEHTSDQIEHHEDENGEHHYTEEEKDQIASRCLRLFNIILLLLGAALCGGSLYGSTISGEGVGSGLFYAMAGVGGGLVAVTSVGLIGALSRWQPILLAYHVCIVFVAFAVLILGGFCFILQETVVQWVQSNWAYVLQSLPQSQRPTASSSSYVNNVKMAMSIAGAVCFLLLSCLGLTIHHVLQLVSRLKGYTLILEASNTTLMPIGIALIGISTYVASTAVGSQAIVPAFALFVLGIVVILLLVIGFSGTVLRSRGILFLFAVLTTLIALVFLAFGIASFVLQERVIDAVSSNWESIRKVLPNDFAGKYDKDQFSVYLRSNLAAIGFLAVCTGILNIGQTFSSMQLRFELKAMSELEQQIEMAKKDGHLDAAEAEELLSLRTPSPLEKMWKLWWKHGDRTSRAAVVFVCMFLLFVVAVIVGIALAWLYYSSTCVSLARSIETYDYKNADLGRVIILTNNYTRGSISVTIASSVATAVTTLVCKKLAYADGMASAGFPLVLPLQAAWGSGKVDVFYTGNASAPVQAVAVTALPGGPSNYFGVDISCQSSDLVLSLPSATLLGGNSYNNDDALKQHVLSLNTAGPDTSISVDFSSFATSHRPRLLRADLKSVNGEINLKSVLIGAKGLSSISTGGQMNFNDLDVQCDPADLGDVAVGGISLLSSSGTIKVSTVRVVDCDVRIQTGAAPSNIDNLVFSSAMSSSGGTGQLTVVGASGATVISSTTVGSLTILGETGFVTVSNVSVSRNIRASTTGGSVQILKSRFTLGAGVQVDSDDGHITIWASRFAGILSIVTSGTITCSGSGFDLQKSGSTSSTPCSDRTVELGADGTSLTVVDQSTVNCAAKGDCPYLGSVVITSARGNVNVIMDAWSR